MPTLRSQKDLRRVQGLPFCYLCTQFFTDEDRRARLVDREHIPPKSCFAAADRSPPLILPTHKRCNNFHSGQDEVLGQLVATQHGVPRSSRDVSRLNLTLSPFPGTEGMLASIQGLPLRQSISRCVRGFHAALYGKPLFALEGALMEPMPSSDDGKTLNPIHPMYYELVKTLKANRLTNSIDVIETNNSKCKYFCTWTRLDPRHELDAGTPVCFFALDIYDWSKLGAGSVAPPRTCVGWYEAGPDGFPIDAARATDIVFRFSNTRPLDPFLD